MEHVVLLRTFDHELDSEELRQITADASECLGMYRIKPVRSYLSADRRELVCVFEAPDAEGVRTVGARPPGLVDMRVFTSTVFAPD